MILMLPPPGDISKENITVHLQQEYKLCCGLRYDEEIHKQL